MPWWRSNIGMFFFFLNKLLKGKTSREGIKKKKGTASVCEAKAYLLDLT